MLTPNWTSCWRSYGPSWLAIRFHCVFCVPASAPVIVVYALRGELVTAPTCAQSSAHGAYVAPCRTLWQNVISWTNCDGRRRDQPPCQVECGCIYPAAAGKHRPQEKGSMQ